MYKIGDFSKLSRVPVKTLRYYDEVDLIKPDLIDRFTSYRYYTAGQLTRLNRILALKDLGLSLEQIRQIVNANPSAEQLRGMLVMRKAQLGQQIGEAQAQMERLEARLRQIDQEGKMPEYEVVLKQLDPQWVAALKAVVPNYDEIGGKFNQMFSSLFPFVYQHGGPVGVPMSLYHEEGEEGIPFEVAVPVSGPVPGSEPFEVYQLPAITAACAVHHGSYENIGSVYQAVMAFNQSNGYKICGPSRELYLQFDPQADPSTYVTEIQMPVTKA